MNGCAQRSQPHSISTEIFSCAIEVELKLFQLDVVSPRFANETFRKVDNRVRDRVVCSKWAGVGRYAERERTMFGLPFDRFPIDRCFDDFRFFPAEINFRAEQDDSVHLSIGFANGVDYCRVPFPLPDITPLLERSGNPFRASAAARKCEQGNEKNRVRVQLDPERSIEGPILDRFAHVLWQDVDLIVQVGDGARNFQDSIVSARAQVQFTHRHAN